MKSFYFFFLFLYFSSFVYCDKIFVKSTGNDTSSCGSTDNPCGSLFYAITLSSSNDIIYLYPGSYNSSGMTSVISHNLTFEAAVPGEGPPIIDFQGVCLPNSNKYAIGIKDYTEFIQVKFSLLKFVNMVCQDFTPSIIYLESVLQTGKNAAHLIFDSVTFDSNMYSMSSSSLKYIRNKQANEVPITGLVNVVIPPNADPVSIHVGNSLFTNNNAVGFSSLGPLDAEFYQTGTYSSSFYEFPPYYIIESHKTNFSECFFNFNYIYDQPLASFIYFNASESFGSQLIIEESTFKDGYSPAVRTQGPTFLTVHDSVFLYLSNTQARGELLPPHIGSATAISYIQIETTTIQGTIAIKESTFAFNGLNEEDKALPCVVGASGFASMEIHNSVFEFNGVASTAVTDVGKNGNFGIKNTLYSSNTARAVVLPAHGVNSYSVDMENCNFENNTFPIETFGAAIEIGGIFGPNIASNTVAIRGSVITGSNIGIFVGTDESLTLDGVSITDCPVPIKCYQGIVDGEGVTIDTDVECLQCDVNIDNTALCSY